MWWRWRWGMSWRWGQNGGQIGAGGGVTLIVGSNYGGDGGFGVALSDILATGTALRRWTCAQIAQDGIQIRSKAVQHLPILK